MSKYERFDPNNPDHLRTVHLDAKVVYQNGRFMSVIGHPLSGGGFQTFVCFDPGAQALPITPEGNVIVIGQIRNTLEGPIEVLEFPGGVIDPGETPQQTACRETLEECGYEARGEIIQLTPDKGYNFSDARTIADQHFFLLLEAVKVRDVTDTETQWVREISFEQLLQAVDAQMPVGDDDERVESEFVIQEGIIVTWTLMADRYIRYHEQDLLPQHHAPHLM